MIAALPLIPLGAYVIRRQPPLLNPVLGPILLYFVGLAAFGTLTWLIGRLQTLLLDLVVALFLSFALEPVVEGCGPRAGADDGIDPGGDRRGGPGLCGSGRHRWIPGSHPNVTGLRRKCAQTILRCVSLPAWDVLASSLVGA